MNLLIYGVYDDNNLGDDYMMLKINQFLMDKDVKPVFVERTIERNNYFNDSNKIKYLYNPIIHKENGKLKKLKKMCKIVKWLFLSNDIKEFDALIFMGGGYTNEQFGNLNLIKLLMWKIKFKKLNKKIFFTGQTIGPAHKFITKLLLKCLYKNVSKVNVREKYSLKYIQNHNIKGALVGDDAYLDLVDNKIIKKENILIINYKCFDGYNNEEMFINAIIKFAKKNNLKVVVIPFRAEEKYEEYKVNYKLYLKLKENNIDSEFVVERNIEKLEVLFKKSKYVIGTAYHSIVLGLKYNNIVMSAYKGEYYKIKMTGILDWYNLNNSAISLNMFGERSINTILNKEKNINVIKKTTNKLIASLNNEWNNIIKDVKEN